jgi:glycosyltransferase involved in cell wall biosynthesis
METTPLRRQGVEPETTGESTDQLSAIGTENGPLTKGDGASARVEGRRDLIRNGFHPNKRLPVLAVLCYEEPASPIGRFLSQLTRALADRQTPVHIFSRTPFEFFHPGIYVHALGDCPGDTLIDCVHEFTRRACNAFQRQFPAGTDNVTVLGHEWTTIPALSLLHASRNLPTMLALDSLERQRSGLSSDLSRKIDDIEQAGLRELRTILTHPGPVGEKAKELVPECQSRLVPLRWVFPAEEFAAKIDPGEIKARHNIGPVDPTILFVGDMDERHGPDLLMKAIPAIVKNHKQARFAFVGDGSLWWPLRVHARYLLLEHVVRLIGDLQGQPLRELVQAADIIAVPSREVTEWWPILAGWAARRPVLTTHTMAKSPLQLEHEKDSVLIYTSPSSCVWGVERLLFDPDLASTITTNARKKLDDRFGWAAVAAQVQELMGVTTAR